MAAGGAYVAWAALAVVSLGTLAARARHPRTLQIPVLTLCATGAIAAFTVVSWGRATPFGDFNKAYYPAGSAILHDPSRLYACDPGNLCFVNVPIVALLFAPLSALDLATAQALYAITGAVAIAAAGWLAVRDLPRGSVRRAAIPLLIAFNGPLLYSARLGNLTHVLLPVIIVAFVWLRRQRDVGAGALLGALAVLKPPLLLFLPYLAFRRQAAAVALFATSAAIVIVSVAVFGVDLHRQWLADLVGPLSSRPVGAYNVQSIPGLLAHFQHPEALADWTPLNVGPTFRLVSLAIVGCGVLASAAVLLTAGQPATAAATMAELSVVLVLILLVGPVTWTHYYAFCLIPLIGYAGGTFPLPAVGRRAALGLAGVLVSVPVVLAVPDRPWLHMLVARVAISHYVAGAILLLAVLCATVLDQRPAAIVGRRNRPGQSAGTPRVDSALGR